MSTKNTQPAVVYTIGHSSRPIDSLLAMLGAAGIEILIDVRAQLGSLRFPQFESDALRHAVNASDIDYPAARWDSTDQVYDRSGQPPLSLDG